MSKVSDSGIEEQQAAHETKSVTITVTLPHDIADQAEEVQKSDPEFLSRVVLYALTRRSIYHTLRERHLDEPGPRIPSDGTVDLNEVVPGPMTRSDGSVVNFGRDESGSVVVLDDGMEPISPEEGRRILAENRHHDGGAWAEKERPSQDEIDEANYNNSLSFLELK